MTLIIAGGTVIDGTGASPYLATIVVSGSSIASVLQLDEPSEDELPVAAETIDVSGKWVLPGLINMHEHLMLRELVGHPSEPALLDPAEQTFIAIRNAVVGLQRGWTTVRDMASMRGIALRVRDLIARGEMPGPRVIAVGSPISVTGGHAYDICIEADGADECRRAAREQLKQGTDFVKVMASHDPYAMPGFEQSRPEMSFEEIEAAFSEARRWGKRTACHAMGATAIANVLDAGVDIIDHGIYLDDELANRMSESNTYLCPTLSAYGRQTMNPRFGRGAEWAQAHAVLVAPHEASFGAALRAGVRVVAGTDTTGSYSEEIELMRAGGMSPMDTILACTGTAAEALGLEEVLGTLRPGLAADLVVLDADPLLDARALDAVSLVIKAGRPHSPQDLDLFGDTGPELGLFPLRA